MKKLMVRKLALGCLLLGTSSPVHAASIEVGDVLVEIKGGGLSVGTGIILDLPVTHNFKLDI